jgi:hypothetical protein
MTTDATKLKHMVGSQALAISAQIDGTVSADTLCKSGIPYPTAIALAAIISSGGAGGARDIQALHVLGYSAADAAVIVAAAVARGAH